MQRLESSISPPWAGAVVFESKIEGSTTQRIPVAEWPSFCEWFTGNFRGIDAGMQRTGEDSGCVVDFRSRPLVEMKTYVLANGVSTIGLTFATNSHRRLFELTGIKTIQLELDAAGFPKELELACEGERIVLRFTGCTQAAPVYSANSWGE
jgi:hypothetical protein